MDSKSNSLLKWGVLGVVLVAIVAIGYDGNRTKKKDLKEEKVTKQERVVVGEVVRRNVVLMGTEFVIVVDAPKEKALDAIRETVRRIEDVERTISSWRPGSETTQLAQRAGIAPVKMSSDTLTLLIKAKEVHEKTNGAFDVTVGPVWDIWPFRDEALPIPSQAQIDEALKLVGSSEIIINESKRSAYLPKEGMRINFGGIGKGYVAQIAMDVMRQNDIDNAAISAGGDVFLLGEKSTGPWVVGIQNPNWKGEFIDQFVATDLSIATSGDNERYIIRDNKRYGHILDPRTGYPVEGVQSVTVLMKSPILADAYATAVYVMGVKEGMAWVEGMDEVEALIVDANGNVTRSSGWAKLTGKKPPLPEHKLFAKPKEAESIESRVVRTTPASSLQEGSAKGSTKGMVKARSIYIDKTEVSNAAYKKYLNTKNIKGFDHLLQPKGKSSHTPRYWKEYRPPLFRQTVASKIAIFDDKTFQKVDHPVVGIDWWDAYGYCAWAGKRLPSVDEWQTAANGGDNKAIWPWGSKWSYKKANSGGERNGELDGYTYSAPVVSFAAGKTRFGAFNMAGNVAEWTDEGFVAGGSSNNSPTGVGVKAGQFREPGYRTFDIGFRCAK